MMRGKMMGTIAGAKAGQDHDEQERGANVAPIPRTLASIILIPMILSSLTIILSANHFVASVVSLRPF